MLNNDCLWVMDETQLMGVGVETSAQLDGFRHMGTMPTFGVCPTWWMRATLDDARLTTVDQGRPPAGEVKHKCALVTAKGWFAVHSRMFGSLFAACRKVSVEM